MSRLFKNVIGSAVVEKILMTILSITIAASGTLYINNVMKTAVNRQGNHIVLDTNNQISNDKNIKKDGNTFTYLGTEKVDMVYIGIFATDGKYIKSINGFANTKITIPENAGRMSIIYYTPSIQNKWHSINYDMKNYQGKSFYVMCEISPDNKVIKDLKFTTDNNNFFFPDFL